ncbi:AraC family transcriptional regulator [Mucilaginibacter psychrotolerans]|nr:AraC family transcriptional regulator [Mucilaginibacter psychrotolerans]
MTNLVFSPSIVNRSVVSCEHHFFNIQRLGDEAAFQKNALRTDARYRILFVSRGEFEYMVDKRKIAIDSLKVGVIKPKHSFTLPQQDVTSGYVLSFSHDFLQLSTGSSALLQSLFLNLGEQDQVQVPKGEHRFLKDLMDRLIFEFNSDSGMKEEVVRGLFQVFASFLNRATSQMNPVSQGKCLRQTKRFFSLLDQNFATLKMPADYAKLMAVTPAYLNNIVKDTLGNTTSYFIQQRILVEAKRLMTYDELNMKEVAYKLGFFDVSHFSKFFKRITGERFTDFKRTIAA